MPKVTAQATPQSSAKTEAQKRQAYKQAARPDKSPYPPATYPPELAAMHQNAPKVAALMRHLGNPIRLKILCLLSQKSYTVSALQVALNIPQPTLSNQLFRLRGAKLITSKASQRERHYRLNDAALSEVLMTLHRLYCSKP
jgi:DNA-binding transcriptional ArsR family regulator